MLILGVFTAVLGPTCRTLVTVASIWAGTGCRPPIGVWSAMAAGLVSMLRRLVPVPVPEYTIGQLCLSVLDTERQVKKAWVLFWSLV